MRPILFRWRGLTISSYRAMLYVGLVAGIFAGNAAARRRASIRSACSSRPSCCWCRFRRRAADVCRRPLVALPPRYPAYLGSPRRRRRPVRRVDRRAAALGASAWRPSPAARRVLGRGRVHDPGRDDLHAHRVPAERLLRGTSIARVGQSLLPNHLGVWERRIPTQCLEAAWAAVVLAAAVMLLPSRPFPGARFLFVALGYASGRVVLQSTRERRPGGHSFAVPYAVSLALIVSSLAVLTARWPK